MSNQEAIALLRNLEDSLDSYCELSEEGKTAFRMAIEALSSSEFPNSSDTDTISRQAAIDIIEDFPHGDVWNVESMEEMVDRIKQLPSAQPERARGTWMPDTMCYYEERFICSECKGNYKVDTCMGKPMWNFCPNCGAKMEVDDE